MAAPATPTFILNWTNIWYKKLDRMHNASILASATLNDMPFETTGGDSVAQPFTLNGHRGDSGNFQAAQAVASQSEFRNSAKYRWQVPYSEYHGSIQIAHRDIALSKTDRDAATRARQNEVDMAFKQRASNMMRLWFAPLGSQIGSATLASGVLTFTDRHLAAKLFRGDMVQLSANAGDTAGQVVTGSAGFVVKSESEVAGASTGKVSLSQVSNGTVGNPAGVVDGTYFVFRNGEYNSANTSANIIPIQAYLPPAASPTAADLFNVRRSDDSRLQGLRVPDAVLAGRSIGSKIKNWIAQASDIGGIDGSEIDTVILNPIDWQLAEEEFSSTVTRSPVEVGEDGFSRMYINTANGRTKLVNEKHCPQGTAYFLASKQICFHSPTGNIAQWLDEEGSIIRRKESEPVYEMNPVSYLATVMMSPYAHGRMSTTI
jgi:hypothetical protein